jgi:T-complex protein 1 subunit delta
LSAAQDVEAGDGTTSVVVLCSSLLAAAEKMLNKGMFCSPLAESNTTVLTNNINLLS